MMRRISPVLALAFVMAALAGCEKPDPTGPASSARFDLTANVTRAPADGSTTVEICAFVRYPDGTPAEGDPIFFSATCGTLSSATGALAGGSACVTLLAPIAPCTSIVKARAINIEKTIEIVFDPVDSSVIILTASPSSIPANGASTSTITGTLWTDTGDPVPDGTTVSWHTSAGSITSSSTTTGGQATATLTSSNYETVAHVTASSSGASGAVDVMFYSTDVGGVQLTAHPWSIPADGSSQSVITAEVWDQTEVHVPDGTTVRFTRTAGTLSASSATTVRGVATVFLTAGTTPTTSVVTGTAGTVSDSVWVEFTYDEDTLVVIPASITLRSGDQQVFAVQGGDGSYTWWLSSSALGSLSSTSGASVTFTAGSSYVSGTVNVRDGSGRQGSASITIISRITIVPAAADLEVGDTQSFTASGGTGTYIWTLTDGSIGTLNPASGSSTTFSASNEGSATLRATDSNSEYGEAEITVGLDMTVSPSTVTLNVGDTQVFTVTGGSSPYIWTSSNTGVATIAYSTPGTSATVTAAGEGTATITVYDFYSNSAAAQVEVGCDDVNVSPVDPTAQVGEEIQFSASGGTPPYDWASSFVFVGQIDDSGLFRAGPFTGSTTVTATDTSGCAGTSEVTVVP